MIIGIRVCLTLTISTSVLIYRKIPKASASVASDESVQNTDSAGNQGGKTFWSIGKPEMKQQAHKEKIKQQKKKRKRKTDGKYKTLYLKIFCSGNPLKLIVSLLNLSSKANL